MPRPPPGSKRDQDRDNLGGKLAAAHITEQASQTTACQEHYCKYASTSLQKQRLRTALQNNRSAPADALPDLFAVHGLLNPLQGMDTAGVTPVMLYSQCHHKLDILLIQVVVVCCQVACVVAEHIARCLAECVPDAG